LSHNHKPRHEIENCVKLLTEQQQTELGESNIQPDYVYALIMVPPKVLISDFAGTVKGRIAIRALNNNRNLQSNPIRVTISSLPPLGQWHSFKLFVVISNDYMIFDKIDKICIRTNPA